MRKKSCLILIGVFSTLVSGSFIAVNAQESTVDNSPEPSPMTEAQAVDLAQDENNTTTTEDATSEAQTDSSELSVSPRFYINHSSSGGGFDGFTGVEGFIPLDQTPGRNVTYFNGRVNLDNDANFGSNVIFGHRSYSPEDRTIYGGYAAWDVRNTGSETFHQLGVGVEGLGETWDWRINGYLPIGETRQGEGSNGSQITGVNFQNNTLLLDVVDFSNFQSALGGLEAEVGAKIAEFDNGGDLRAFGGVYFLDGEGTDGTIGGRFRAEVRPLESLSLGAGVQFDDIFGTNLLFQVRFGLPLQVARSSDEPQTPELLYSRLADPIVRNNAIIIDQQVVNDSQANVVAVDPTTGTAYTILHVDPTTGAVANAGTFEAPVDSIANAVPLAASGDIVYVQAGNAGGGFTIPDGVQILSVAPVQTITTQFGDTQLPGSGSGSRPVIDSSSIGLGNNTTLSGFEITNAPGDAVSGNNISNVTIQNNLINAALGAGINLENVGGIVLIENNQLENSVFDTGIFITTSGAVTQQLTIVGNTISGNAEQAILLRATGNAQVTATVQDNTMTGNNTAVSGIEIEANNTAPGSLCLDLNGNNSDTNYLLTLFPDGQFQVVNQADLSVNNTGTVSQTDISTSTNFVSVNVCP